MICKHQVGPHTGRSQGVQRINNMASPQWATEGYAVDHSAVHPTHGRPQTPPLRWRPAVPAPDRCLARQFRHKLSYTSQQRQQKQQPREHGMWVQHQTRICMLWLSIYQTNYCKSTLTDSIDGSMRTSSTKGLLGTLSPRPPGCTSVRGRFASSVTPPKPTRLTDVEVPT